MTVALMPGDEPIELKFKEPEPIGRLSAVGGAAEGCACPHCNQLRQEAREFEQRRAATMAVQYGEYPRGMPMGMIRGRYDMSHSRNPNDGMHGQVRWRDPGTMQVFDAEGRRQWTYDEELPDGTLVDRQNRRWVPDNVREDRYDSIQAMMQTMARPVPPPVFDWHTEPPPLYVTDYLGNIRRSPV